MGRNKTSNLVPFNSKVDPAVKDIIDALVLVKAGGAVSVHELLKVMLTQYEEVNPEAFAKARDFLALMADKPPTIYKDPAEGSTL